jgi:hypothetical protein
MKPRCFVCRVPLDDRRARALDLRCEANCPQTAIARRRRGRGRRCLLASVPARAGRSGMCTQDPPAAGSRPPRTATPVRAWAYPAVGPPRLSPAVAVAVPVPRHTAPRVSTGRDRPSKDRGSFLGYTRHRFAELIARDLHVRCVFFRVTHYECGFLPVMVIL